MSRTGATMIIGGERRAAASGTVDEITSPWDGRVVGIVPRAAPADADAAAAAAVERISRPAGVKRYFTRGTRASRKCGLEGSGIGKEGPRRAVAEMTEEKAVVLHGRPW